MEKQEEVHRDSSNSNSNQEKVLDLMKSMHENNKLARKHVQISENLFSKSNPAEFQKIEQEKYNRSSNSNSNLEDREEEVVPQKELPTGNEFVQNMLRARERFMQAQQKSKALELSPGVKFALFVKDNIASILMGVLGGAALYYGYNYMFSKNNTNDIISESVVSDE